MAEQFDTRPTQTDRFDLHNGNVDQELARDNLCGTRDYRNGNACHRTALHPGPCAFESAGAPAPPDPQH